MPSAPVVRRPSLSDQVTERVRAMVRAGELTEDSLYSVYQLADLLEVSRSPVREALLKLEAAGLVTFERNRGFRVVLPSARQIEEIFEIRLALEPAAAAAAARRPVAERDLVAQRFGVLEEAAVGLDEATFWEADQSVHDALLQLAGNREAAAVIRQLRQKTRMIGPGTTRQTRSLSDISAEHAPIVEAVVAGDAAAARSAMAEHLRNTGALLAAAL